MNELIVDQSDWGHIRVTGEDRVRFLHGMCTADVAGLTEGGWAHAALLNPKGRVMSMFDVVQRGDHLLLICQPDLTDKTIALLDAHVLMDDVELEPTRVEVHRVWGAPETVWDAAPVLAPLPGPAASAEAVEVRRIEAGLPRYGVDVTEDHFPFENPLGRTIDYEKGCYLGQEPVYRVYARGQAARVLRGLRLEGAEVPGAGAGVSHPERKNAGVVTSAARSPDFGSIALAYLHRTVWDPGNRVTVGDRPAAVVELPFTATR
jgi:tRNA-modifying protein YgfZ